MSIDVAPLTLAYSPCPNDTFIFTPWVEGHIPGAPPVVERYEDIDVLNRSALAGEADVIKLSFHAYGHCRDRYCLLRSGGALGRGCGPLVVSRTSCPSEDLHTKTVAIPGALTTAALLLRLFVPALPDTKIVVMPFHQILAAVRDGQVDCGLIIHESRFTYQRYGLSQVVDLGDWWEQHTGQAIPLGAVAMRRALGVDLIGRTERALAESVEFAHKHPDLVWPTVRRHAQELDDAVMRQHIDLYVNTFSRDYGLEGQAAIEHLLQTAERLGVVPGSTKALFET